MTKRFFTTLAVSLLGWFTIQAQAPFTGTVEYKMEVGNREAASPNFIVQYNKQYIKLQANISEEEGQSVKKTLVIDFVTGGTYDISHKVKTIVKKSFAMSKENEVQINNTPIDSGKIANVAAKAYKAIIAGNVNGTVWLADSLPLAVPANLKKTNDLFIWAMDRLMLKIEVPARNSFDNGFSIQAIRVDPAASSDTVFQLPTDYAFTDEAALQKARDSLLKAFNVIDSELVRQQLNTDSAKWVVDQLNSPAKKKTTSPQKPKKTAATKGNKAAARRPKQ